MKHFEKKTNPIKTWYRNEKILKFLGITLIIAGTTIIFVFPILAKIGAISTAFGFYSLILQQTMHQRMPLGNSQTLNADLTVCYQRIDRTSRNAYLIGLASSLSAISPDIVTNLPYIGSIAEDKIIIIWPLFFLFALNFLAKLHFYQTDLQLLKGVPNTPFEDSKDVEDKSNIRVNIEILLPSASCVMTLAISIYQFAAIAGFSFVKALKFAS